MNPVFARNYLVQALKQSYLSYTTSVGVSIKALNYSTSCQPSLEVGDISPSEVREESQMQQAGVVKEQIEESREELVSKTQLVQNVQPHLKPDQDEHLKRFPLKVVVQSCVKRWFKEHLRNAEKGDSDAQVMVGQMISHGEKNGSREDAAEKSKAKSHLEKSCWRIRISISCDLHFVNPVSHVPDILVAVDLTLFKWSHLA